MTPREYGETLAAEASPITQEQAETAARILITVERDEAAA